MAGMASRTAPRRNGDRHPRRRAPGRASTRGASCSSTREPWSLDWWIGAEDRWHVPADEAVGAPGARSARRRWWRRGCGCPAATPCTGPTRPADAGGVPVVVVEVENRSQVPFAVAPGRPPAGPRRRRARSRRSPPRAPRCASTDGSCSSRPARPGAGSRRAGDDGAASPRSCSAATPRPRPRWRPAAPEGRPRPRSCSRSPTPRRCASSCRSSAGPFDVAAPARRRAGRVGLAGPRPRGARIVVPDAPPAGRRRRQPQPPAPAPARRPRGRGARPLRLRRGGGARRCSADPAVDRPPAEPGAALLALAAHWTLTRDQAFADAAAPVDRAARRRAGALAARPSTSPLGAGRVGRCRRAARRRGRAPRGRRTSAAPAPTMADLRRPARRPPRARRRSTRSQELLRIASATWTWAGPTDGHDPDVGAAVLVGAPALLVAETRASERRAGPVPGRAGGLATGRAGRSTTCRRASGRCRYAVRWHGDRPALLWDLEPARRLAGAAHRARARPGVVDHRAARRGAARAGRSRRRRRMSDPRSPTWRAARRRLPPLATSSSPCCGPSARPSEEIERAEADGTLVLLAIDHLALGQELLYDLDEACERTGLPEDELRHIWRSLGFPDPPRRRAHLLRRSTSTTSRRWPRLLHSGAVSPRGDLRDDTGRSARRWRASRRPWSTP